MKLLRHRLVRLPIIAIGAAAWLAISNHCALAAFERPIATTMPSCHDMAPAKHSPGKHDEHSGAECCKVLRATLLDFSKDLTASDALTFAAQNYVVGLVPPLVDLQQRRTFEWDTGPPGSRSFADLVLGRSLLAHAPPVALS